MRFEYPELLWLLLVFAPALAAFFWWVTCKRQALMKHFIQARLLPGLTSGLSPGRQKFRFGCVVAAVTLLIITLARPQWGYHYEEVKQRGLDIVVAIDTSKSMLAQDIAPNRLARAKLAALDLMQQAKSDRLGLVAFAGGAFLQCPLTIDDIAFRQSVEALDVNIIPQGGTAIGAAITTALTAFKERDNYKILVLFTDGEDNDEGALPAAKAAAKEGLRIFTVGVGTADGELLRISDNKGRTDYIRDEQGNVVKSRLNEALLQQIAGETEGGFYLPLRGAKAVDTLYERGLAPLPKSQQSTRLVRQYHEQFHWPLAAAIALLLTEMLLPERRRRTGRSRTRNADFNRKAAPGAVASKKPALAATVILALLIPPEIASGSASSALNDYKSGNYTGALQEYQRTLQHKTNDMRLNFNTGAAAYRSERYEQAARQFGRTTTARDVNLQQQAYYNLGNTLYRIGENISDRDKKIESWESALKQYDGAIKLNTNDADAKFNYEFVKRKLEELKQEKQQQDQQQDQQDQQQGGEQDQQKQDQKDQQNQQGNSGQQKEEQKQDEQQQQGQNQSDEQKERQKNEQPQPKPSDSEQKKESEPQGQGNAGEMAGARPMTPEEAKQLMDSQKGDEQILQFKPVELPENRDRPFKDW
jgi:Ca-activated chloride channel family protein